MISYQFDPEGHLTQLADRLKSLKSFEVPLERCGTVAMRSADTNFAAQGRPAGWTGMSKITAALRRGGGGQALRDTGRLMQSVVQRGSAGNVYRLGPHELTFGSNLLYARIHQFGGTIRVKNAKVLARPVDASEASALRAMGANVSTNKQTGQSYLILGKSVTIPARPFLVLQPEDIVKFNRIFGDWVKQQLTGGGQT